MRRIMIYAAFIIAVVAIGMAIGAVTRPGAWYAALVKPPFNPPNWVFGPVWALLYVMIGIAGARSFEYGAGMRLWFTQMALNFAWSPAFFALQRPAVALVIVLGMLAAIIAFIVARWNADRVSALLFVPYAAWVAFASLLNAAIVVLN
ncbi:TspO/MBR family protein [Pseudorhodoplanes sp.]|uniref:TspO/MBR family protein n=1 Tax=Pseudorhodoplanes sp. TaxID=1934341 RepID=UPI003918FEE8